jgi:drug/metabolite transporter (DMT)-like permease
MLVSFSAVLAIIYLSSQLDTNGIASSEAQSSSFYLGVIANSLCAVGFSVVNVVVRSLREVHHSLVASFQSSANFLFSLVGLVIYRTVVSPNGFSYGISLWQWCMLLLSGLVRSFGMLFYVRAFQLDKAGRAASLNFLQIIFGYSFDVALFGYGLRWFEVAGTLVIAACSVMVFVIKIFKVRD